MLEMFFHSIVFRDFVFSRHEKFLQTLSFIDLAGQFATVSRVIYKRQTLMGKVIVVCVIFMKSGKECVWCARAACLMCVKLTCQQASPLWFAPFAYLSTLSATQALLHIHACSYIFPCSHIVWLCWSSALKRTQLSLQTKYR